MVEECMWMYSTSVVTGTFISKVTNSMENTVPTFTDGYRHRERCDDLI